MWTKRIVGIIYILLLVVMAAATIIENFTNTQYVQQNIYGSWWFCTLWGLLVACGIAYIIKRKMRKWNLLLLHFSFIVILTGALLTHLTSFKGIIHLRGNVPTNKYSEMESMSKSNTFSLPFYLKLDKFQLMSHAGTDAPSDYVTHFTIIDGNNKYKGVVSMNNIAKYHGIRFYQASYDTDNLGSYLQINSDRYGIPVTYSGYGILFFSLLWLLVDPKGTFRKLAKKLKTIPDFCLTLFFVSSFLLFCSKSNAVTTVPKETADDFGNLLINYNQRICPVQTFAIDFTQKIYGRRSYKGLNANQVLLSWIFFPQDWSNEPFIKVKNKQMRDNLGLEKYSSVGAFFRDGNYILGELAADYGEGKNKDAYHKACADIDGKLNIIMSLRQGIPLSMFPHTYKDGVTQWYSPFEKYPKRLPKEEIVFIKNIFPFMYSYVVQGEYGQVNTILSKIGEYQIKNGGASIPSHFRIKAEHVYNACPLATILFIINLTFGFIGIVLVYVRISMNGKEKKRKILTGVVPFATLDIVLTLSFLALTLQLALRWIITGNVPMGNGYETMLTVAWMTQLCGLLMIAVTHRANGLFTSFALLLSGFFLLVSHLSMMNPALGQLVPVLNSPLLSLHVSFMMISYALLGLTFLCSMMALAMPRIAESLQVLSRFMLYPAMTTLGIGIFLGAIWANVSWGTYWSWDPKETWALITFMIYAIALHSASLPVLQKPRTYHVFMLLALFSIIVTYFGVNYFMGGMHSYA